MFPVEYTIKGTRNDFRNKGSNRMITSENQVYQGRLSLQLFCKSLMKNVNVVCRNSQKDVIVHLKEILITWQDNKALKFHMVTLGFREYCHTTGMISALAGERLCRFSKSNHGIKIDLC